MNIVNEFSKEIHNICFDLSWVICKKQKDIFYAFSISLEISACIMKLKLVLNTFILSEQLRYPKVNNINNYTFIK